ncbi:hypothetical protein H2200_000676 [Cladophialophora chaetospira]|uniref:Uncharacterized protein n=1 Tax=Cladophialophora chaetospira TaxID=386627 RepID=A0AA38XPR0_9EURO|nr:hypothetical protein H2200_000676 [Cladophialophora chaetospira]
MAKEGPVWTRDKLKQLYGALDEAVKTASGSNLYSAAVDLIVAATGLTKAQVTNKLRALGRELKPNLNKEEFIEKWTANSAQFKKSGSDTGRRSPRSSSRASVRASSRPSEEGARSKPSQSSKSTTLREQDTVHVDHQEAASDGEQDNGNHGEQINGGDEEGDKPVSKQPGDNSDEDEEDDSDREEIALEPEEIEMIQAWRRRMENRRFGAPPRTMDTKRLLSNIWRLVNDAVESFCKAQPIAFVSTAKMTRATVDLARTFVNGSGRFQVEECLRTLFGDPALSVSLILRTFASAAITAWVFEEFPQYRAPPENSELGASLEAFAEYIPQAAHETRQALEIRYFETVVEPTFPLLARQYQIDLFDIFLSLRAAPEPHFDSPNEDPDASQAFQFRQQHQAEWVAHIEAAFLAALNLRSSMAKSTSIFIFNTFRQGDQFDDKRMKAMVETRDTKRITSQHQILLCMSPKITKYRRDTSGQLKDRFPVAEAKVIIEGFEVSYPSLLGVDRSPWDDI